MRDTNVVRPILIGLGLFTVLALVSHMNSMLSGNWTLVAQEVTKHWVALAALGIIFYMFRYQLGARGGNDAGALALQIGFGSAGIVISDMLNRLNTEGILIDEMITGTITISDLMIVNLMVWIIMGLIAGGLY